MIKCSTAPLSCAVDKKTYRLIDQWFGRALAEKLLYRPPPGEEDLHDVVGLHTGYDSHDSEERHHRQLGGGRSYFAFEEPEAEALYQCTPAGTAAGSPRG